MGLKKCPRCELNYIKDDEKLCNVCKRSAKLSNESEEEAMCIECGEHPALKGKELCSECYRESIRINSQNKHKNDGVDYGDVDDVTDVTMPDEEIPMGSLPDEIAGDFADEPVSEQSKDDGEIEFTKGLSIEVLEEEEDSEPDDDFEIDEGITPARRKHR
ncbi:MAG: hypothetical protein IKH21_03795 [Clostridia bacterium]|nr:hypothetical protein [Clostridia bacterium]MBR3459900.1 hypothetical protein [Clostridia bacterium]MBR5713929.1 hypothetical protein [Clostridia bacterium]MBR5718301.1 hypothetical protein [Clostridia bacterium]